MVVGDISWADIFKVLASGGIVFVIGFFLFVLAPNATAFTLKGTEWGVILIFLGIIGFIFGYWKFKR